MQTSAVTLTAAFACIAGTVLTGAAVRGREPVRALTRAATPLLRGLAMAAIVAVGAALAIAAVGLRAGAEPGGRIVAFSDSAAALDRSLRAAGPEAEPARVLLFRLVDRLSRELSASQTLGGPFDSESAAALHRMLHAAVDALATGGSPAGIAAAHAMAGLADAFAALEEGRSAGPARWLAIAALGWLLVGVGWLGLVAWREQTGAIVLVLLAGAVALAIFVAEDLASPAGTLSRTRLPLAVALITITE